MPASSTSTDAHRFDPLAGRLSGQLLLPRHPVYHTHRQVWNAAVDRHPLAIAVCASEIDVVYAVRFAAEQQLRICVRGGGHHIAGLAVQDGALMLDLRLLNRVQVAVPALRLTAQGGALWRDVLTANRPHNLATPGGFHPAVGVGGSTLAGGYGALSRLYGFACDNLLSVRMVDAAGEIRQVDDHTHPELMWAMRGAGTNFGVVTQLEFALHRLPALYAGCAYYDLKDFTQVAAQYREYLPQLPDASLAYLGILNEQNADPVFFISALHIGQEADAVRHLAPLARFAKPLCTLASRIDYDTIHVRNQNAFLDNQHNMWRAHFLPALTDNSIAALERAAQQTRGQYFHAVIEHMGGAMHREPRRSCFAHRHACFGIALTTRTPRGMPLPASGSVLETCYRQMAPDACGVYSNYVMETDNPAEIRRAHGSNHEDLLLLKRKHDSQNRFHTFLSVS